MKDEAKKLIVKMLEHRDGTTCDHCERQYDDSTCDDCFAEEIIRALQKLKVTL